METPQRLPPVRELLKAALKVDAELAAEREKAKQAASRASARKKPFGPPGTPRGGYRPTPPSSTNGRRAAGAKSLTDSAGRLPSVSARGPNDSRRDSLAEESGTSTPRRRRLGGGLSDTQMKQNTGRAPVPWWWGAQIPASSSRATYVHWLYAQSLGFQGFSVGIGAHGQLELTVPAPLKSSDQKKVVARAVEQSAHAGLFDLVTSALNDARATLLQRAVTDADAALQQAIEALDKKVTELADITKPSDEQLEEKASLDADVAAATATHGLALANVRSSLPDGYLSYGPMIDLLPYGCKFQGTVELSFEIGATFGDYEGDAIVVVLRRDAESAPWAPLDQGESLTVSATGKVALKLQSFCTIMLVWTKGMEHQSAVVQMLSTGFLDAAERNGLRIDATSAAEFTVGGLVVLGVSQGSEDEVANCVEEGAEPEHEEEQQPTHNNLRILPRHQVSTQMSEQVKTTVFEDIFRREKDAEAAAEVQRLEEQALAAAAERKAALPDMLRAAAKAGEAAKVLELLQEGAGINDVDANGWTALYTATVYGKEEAVKSLLGWTNPPAEVDKANNNGVTALMAAARDGYTQVVVQLLDRGADVQQVDEFGRTVSGYCFLHGHNSCKRGFAHLSVRTVELRVLI